MKATDEMKRMRAQGMSYQAIADKAGVAKSTVQEAMGARKRNRNAPLAHPHVAIAHDIKRAGRSLAEFRQTYDKDTIVPAKIKAALKVLGSGWEYEVQFAKLAGLTLADLGNYRDQYADYVVTLRESRRAWAGTVATARAMKGML